MKPSARLRTRPRSRSDSRANAAPWTSTSPSVGASSPPSRWSNVLLPDPDAPTTARRSPGCTARSMPSNTGTSSGPARYVFLSPRHSSTAVGSLLSGALRSAMLGLAGLLITQRLRRIYFGRPPAGIQRREQGQGQRDQRNQRDIATLQIRWQLADVVDGLVQKLDAERALDEWHHRADVERQRDTAGNAEQCANGADQRALNHEDRQYARRCCAKRAQDGDVGLLVGDHHHLRRDNVKCRHGNDQRQDNE